MKANQLATLILRLLAIYYLLEIVPTVAALSSLIFTMRAMGHPDISSFSVFAPVLIPSISLVIVGVLLFVCSGQWSEKLTKSFGETNISMTSFEEIQVLTFAVTGVFIFAEGASQLFGSVYSASISLRHLNKDQYPSGMQFNDWHSLLIAIGVILKTALGLWMFFGTHGFAKFWRSSRSFGTPNPPQN